MARPHQLAIRLSRAENAYVNRQAKAAKLAPSVWARERLLEASSHGRASSESAQTSPNGSRVGPDDQKPAALQTAGLPDSR